jgi:hypothetical protein
VASAGVLGECRPSGIDANTVSPASLEQNRGKVRTTSRLLREWRATRSGVRRTKDSSTRTKTPNEVNLIDAVVAGQSVVHESEMESKYQRGQELGLLRFI